MSPGLILGNVILTGSLKFGTDNDFMLPAMTKLFNFLELLLLLSSAKNFVSLYSVKTKVWSPGLFASVELLKILFGILRDEADSLDPTVSLTKFIEILSFVNGERLSTLPEKVSPLKDCGCTASKFTAKFLFTLRNFRLELMFIDSSKMFKVLTSLQDNYRQILCMDFAEESVTFWVTLFLLYNV